MIRQIRRNEADDLAKILGSAYPTSQVSSESERTRLAKQLQAEEEQPASRRFFGAFRDDRLVGAMRLLDFRLNVHSHMVDAGGVGGVGVDLLNKKEGVAKELLTGFLTYYREKNAPVVLLYAFRTDFYYQMGFGHGPQWFQYKLRPNRFPKGPSKAHIVRLSGRGIDKVQFVDYYRNLVANIHGLIARSDADIDDLFSAPRIVLGYRDGDHLAGYMVCSVQPENVSDGIDHNILVNEYFYDGPAVLSEFFTFLHSQDDQFRFIAFGTQDPDFYHLIPNSQNDTNHVHNTYHETNASAVGLMYRVIDTGRLFEALGEHDFGGQTCTVRFAIADTFLAANAIPVTIRFEGGRARPVSSNAPCDCTVNMGIGPFSSWIMGVAPFRKLCAYGLASVSDDRYLDVIDRLVRVDQGPVCVTVF